MINKTLNGETHIAPAKRVQQRPAKPFYPIQRRLLTTLEGYVEAAKIMKPIDTWNISTSAYAPLEMGSNAVSNRQEAQKC